MQFVLSEEQAALKDAVERFVKARYGVAQRRQYRAEASGYSRENWQGLAQLGLLGLLFPAEYGGLGGGPGDLIAVMEALGGGLVVEPMLEEVIVAGGVLAHAGSQGQKAHWLPRITSGDAHVALAHFEQSARFNLSDVRLRATACAGGWVLDGEKSVVPLAAGADAYIVSAREIRDSTDPGGSGLYLVAAGSPGIERVDFRLVDGATASVLRLGGVLTADRLDGRFGDFARAVDFGRLAAGAEMVGLMSMLFNSTLDYLRTRKQFGAPLSSFQAIQHRLADLYVVLEQSRSQVCRAAAFIGSGKDAGRSVAGMKSYVGRAAIAMGEACVHLHGGIGMSEELAIGHGFKRLLVLAHLFGDPDSELARFTRFLDDRHPDEARPQPTAMEWAG